MPKLKLTQANIERLEASQKQTIFWDDRLARFGLLVSGNTKAFVAQGTVNGKSKRVTIGRFGQMTEREARQKALEMIAAFRGGTDPTRPRVSGLTVGQALTMYLRSNTGLRVNSAKAYRTTFDKFFHDWMDKPLASIDRSMVEERHRQITEQVAGRRYQPEATGYGASNFAMKVLRAVHAFAADRDPDLPRNPVRLKQQWHKLQPRQRHLRPHEFAPFFEAVIQLDNEIVRDYLMMALLTGMRRGELASLKWSDVDLPGKTLTVPAERTKSGRPLNLPLNTWVIELLQHRQAFGTVRGFVFPAASRVGHVMDPKHALNQVAEASGVRISVHDLRRSFLTVAESCNVSMHVLKLLVNHSTNDVTAGYVRVSVERLRETAETVATRIMDLCQTGA